MRTRKNLYASAALVLVGLLAGGPAFAKTQKGKVMAVIAPESVAVVNMGQKQGVEEGLELTFQRKQEIKDANGHTIFKDWREVGTMIVVEVEKNRSLARVRATELPLEGDQVVFEREETEEEKRPAGPTTSQLAGGIIGKLLEVYAQRESNRDGDGDSTSHPAAPPTTASGSDGAGAGSTGSGTGAGTGTGSGTGSGSTGSGAGTGTGSGTGSGGTVPPSGGTKGTKINATKGEIVSSMPAHTMILTCTITGKVNGQLPSGMSIAAYGPNQTSKLKSTVAVSANGAFAFTNLPSGQYKLVPQFTGAGIAVQPPFIQANCSSTQTSTVVFTVESKLKIDSRIKANPKVNVRP